MSHWLLDAITDRRSLALREADRVQIHREMGGEAAAFDEALLREMAVALEIAVLDLEVEYPTNEPERLALSRQAAADAFRLLRILPLPAEPLAAGTHLLRASVMAVLGDGGADAARWLRTLEEVGHWPAMPLDAPNWGERCRATLTDVWLRLVRKKGQSDGDAVLEHVAALRSAQEKFEGDYLRTLTPLEAKRGALELIAIYHLTKAAEILAHTITDGVVDNCYHAQPVLDSHFDRAVDACEAARLVELGPMTRLLAHSSAQMVNDALISDKGLWGRASRLK